MATATLGVVLHRAMQLGHALTEQRTDGELLRAFLDATDRDAFEKIVRRHGPTVLRVCRRTLGCASDADDAFQATFLLLARRPASIRKRESLAGWLYGVAYRMATDIRRAADRRRKHEQKAKVAQSADPALTAAWREIQSVLEEEIANLPDTYREPFVLCCLENLSTSEVATRLRRDETVVRNRLSRARKMLARQLAERGVSLTAALATAAICSGSTLASVSRELLSSSVKIAEQAGVGQMAGGEVSARILSIVNGWNKAMISTKTKVSLLLFLTAGIVSTLVGLGASSSQSAQLPAKEPTTTTAMKAKSETKEVQSPESGPIEIRGRVLDPEGKPVGGSTVAVLTGEKEQTAVQTTGPDGQFKLMAKRDYPKQRISVMATAKGYGHDWMHLDLGVKADEIVLRLTKDDLAITGRIVGLEGKPVAVATVRVVKIAKAIEAPPGASRQANEMSKLSAEVGKKNEKLLQPAHNALSSWVKDNVKWLTDHAYAQEMGLSELTPPASVAAPVITDKEGRFRLAGLGIGRDRALILDVSGPGIERRLIWVVTLHPSPKELANVVGLYGPSFEHQVGPAKPAVGTVSDRATGKPLAGIRVVGSVPRMGYAQGLEVDAITDKDGHYRLDGLPKADNYLVTVDSLPGLSYLPQEKTLADTEGLKPLQANFALDHGTLIEGRFLDKQTGKPIQGEVMYFPLPGNKQFSELVRTHMGLAIRHSHRTGADGSFKLLVFPGPGAVCASGDIDTYLLASVEEKDAKAGIGDQITFSWEDENFGMMEVRGHAYKVIQPGVSPESLKLDLSLERGRTITGTCTADGKPVAGVRAVEFSRYGAYDLPIKVTLMEKSTGMFTAVGLDPRRQNLMIFYQEKEGLVGAVEPKGDEKDPVEVRLSRWATASGRILGPDGKPVVGETVQVYCRDVSRQDLRELLSGPLAKPIITDKDGRFRVEGLVPGYQFVVHANFVPKKDSDPISYDFDVGSFKSGEIKDLGNLKFPLPE